MKNIFDFFPFFFFSPLEKANKFFCSKLHLGKVLKLGLQYNEHPILLKK